MPQRLSTLLDPARINLALRHTRRTYALKEVAAQLDGHPAVINYAAFYRELLQRERLDTTVLGNGIALPHARTEHVAHMVLAVGRSDAGITVDDPAEPVHLLFVLGTPKATVTDYLQVVSTLCRILKNPANRTALLTAATPEDFIEVIRHLES
jgi:mannitol/fructose-specific phosphotransferase system IIA component (Ntr-type)